MTNQRRELFFKVMDGQQELLGLLCLLNQHPKCDLILKRLIAGGHTGRTLIEWFRFKFAPSVPKMIAHVLSEPSQPFMLK